MRIRRPPTNDRETSVNFTDLFIRRPVLASVVSLLILVVGIRSFSALQVLAYPKTENGTVTITTQFPGADPDADVYKRQLQHRSHVAAQKLNQPAEQDPIDGRLRQTAAEQGKPRLDHPQLRMHFRFGSYHNYLLSNSCLVYIML